ncbi:hypothetical protein P280DRAFT_551819 [Massarina eburnea CBS 473.64]|uniref:F-box domain-containing protein n=1 Tax=Massarina eburnea CBS 473.64 TaxID=1395130 RepID=A0A6A6RRD2_9PLEO|nr:hypothetical protein P280DRAFT_551819 [Massarina eburnea CBS 473.64]
MSRLLDLPGELLNHVISLIPPQERLTTLRSLCLTSKKFQHIVQPLIFVRITICNSLVKSEQELSDDGDLDEKLKKGMQILPLARLARTFTKRPELAASLQLLECEIPNNKQLKDRVGTFPETDIQLLHDSTPY